MKKSFLLLTGLAGATVYVLSKRRTEPRLPSQSGPHVLILGAGFGGLAAAARLSSSCRRKVRITIVDRHNYHLFTPMLYQASTCGIVPYDAALPVRQWSGRRGIEFRQGTVQRIDLEKHVVHVDNGDLPYDYLVIALGSTTNFFGNQSAATHALPMKTMEDGVSIRNHLIDTFERATVTTDSRERSELLTYVIVGGGATGVETAGGIAGVLHEVLPTDYPALRDRPWHVIVLESESKLLGHMGTTMAEKALQELRKAGVEVRLNTRAGGISDNKIDIGGNTIATRTVIWTTGVRAADVVANIPAEHGHGGSVATDAYLRVKGHSDAYAIGDNASFVDPHTKQHVPILAATAMQQGEAAARNIARSLNGSPLKSFHYRNLGNVVSVGPRTGVAEIGGRVIGGFPGWLTWRAIHVARLSSMRNQLATALDWTTGYFYDFDTARLDVNASKKAA